MSPLRSSAGPAVCDERHAELLGHDAREARLAEAGRAGEQHVVERVAARRGGGDRDAELLLQRLLADEVVEPLRAQRARRARPRPRSCGVWSRSAPGVRIIARALLQRVRDQVLGRLAAARRRAARSASCGEKPRPTRPSRASSRGSSPRAIAIGSSAGRRADLLAQLDDDPLRRALADARARPAAARCRPPRRRRAARAASRPRARRARPSGRRDWTPIRSRKRSRSASEAKP